MIEKIVLKKSVILDKMPAKDQLDFGEIALNYNAEHPFLSFKDSDGNIKALNDYSEDIQELWDNKLDVSYYDEFTNGITQNATDISWLKKNSATKQEISDTKNDIDLAIAERLKITDFDTFKADNTKTINVLDRNVSQNRNEIQQVNGIVQNHTTAITKNTDAIATKADKTELDTINANVDQKVSKTDIVQSTGNSTTSVMSQKAVSDALSNGATKSVLYEDFYYPNMGETTDKVKFSDSTEILQPTKFIESYTDADGTTWDNVFECEKFPDWFNFADKSCYPYGNGNSTGYLFFHNFTVDHNELIYDFYTLQNNNIGQKLPYHGSFI